jgi:dTDP-glucose pyrophosphorylase
MVVVMPMAGRGSRFEGSAYQGPKPLIKVRGKPMFSWALESLKGVNYRQLVVVSLREHEEAFQVSQLVKTYCGPQAELLLLEGVTEGQLATVMAARNYIDKEEGVLIISSDTLVLSQIGKDILHRPAQCEGLISVADMEGDRWSFAKTDENGKVVEVAEKVRISSHASTGMYYFSNGRKMVQLATEMMERHEKTRGEYYVMPLYGKYLQQGSHIGISRASQMWDLGTPQALEAFLTHYPS